jgi:hypothetical protein
MGIDLATQTVQSDVKPFQTADQLGDGDDQRQATDPHGIAQFASLQEDDSSLLITKEMIAAEALAV